MKHSFLLQIEDGHGDDDIARARFQRIAQSVADEVLKVAVDIAKEVDACVDAEIAYLGGN